MYKSAFVAISGQPNVGKSTILNGFLGEKLAIISKRPETTRDNIRGILTDDDLQIVFVDTPGIHKPHDLLGKVMLSKAHSTLLESDLILFVTEKNKAFDTNDSYILDKLPPPGSGKKVILVINKVDRIRQKSLLLPLLKKAARIYPFEEIIPISALKVKDIKRLLSVIRAHLPEGPQMYPSEDLTDKSDVFRIQEIIREKILEQTYREIPHSVAVLVDQIKKGKKGLTSIYTTVFVERASQKSILIGKKGEVMKKVGEFAREDIETLLGKRVYLDLWVKVRDKWKKDPNALKEMGYTD